MFRTALFHVRPIRASSTRLIHISRSCRYPDSSFDQEKAQKIAETPLFQKIAESPTAMAEMRKTMNLLVDEGYIKPGEAPTIMTQMRILANSKFREQLSTMRDAFDEAGIEITKDDAQQLISIMLYKQDTMKEKE